jgi:hypothetical protein
MDLIGGASPRVNLSRCDPNRDGTDELDDPALGRNGLLPIWYLRLAWPAH